MKQNESASCRYTSGVQKYASTRKRWIWKKEKKMAGSFYYYLYIT